jgi:hypothetical protein
VGFGDSEEGELLRLYFGSGMALKDPCVEDLAPDLGLFGGGRTFRRWGHVVEKKLGH